MLEKFGTSLFLLFQFGKKNYTLPTATHRLFNVYEESISSIE